VRPSDREKKREREREKREDGGYDLREGPTRNSSRVDHTSPRCRSYYFFLPPPSLSLVASFYVSGLGIASPASAAGRKRKKREAKSTEEGKREREKEKDPRAKG